MHNLLDLIKKEQNIYNVVFHELIRQVSTPSYSEIMKIIEFVQIALLKSLRYCQR